MTEIVNSREQRREERQRRREERRRRWMERQNHEFGAVHSKHSRVWTGIFILMIGVAALLRTMFPEYFGWLFTWEMLLIALGLFIGVRHNFRGIAWFILILIGGVFIANRYYDAFTFRYIWPLVLIAVGLFIITKPRNRWRSEAEKKIDGPADEAVTPEMSFSKEDFIETTSVFGGAKKIIISKNFRGGDIVNIFGGTELDLSQADLSGVAVIDLTTIFGGTKLLIPSNWSVKSEAVTIFGGIEDKRRMQATIEAPQKTLLLRGTVIFGGIDIKSF
jgi:predicted membrane protein